MVALADALRDGVKSGAGFKSEAYVDAVSDRADFDGRSGLGKITYGLGSMIGEAFNLVCLGVPELVSYNRLINGKDDGLWYDTCDLGDDVEAREERLNEFVSRYVAKYGDNFDGDENSVGGDVESRDGVKSEKCGKRGKLEKSVRAVADIIEKARKDVQYGEVNVDDIYDNVNSALREYEARTGDTLDDAVLRGLDEIIAKDKTRVTMMDYEYLDELHDADEIAKKNIAGNPLLREFDVDVEKDDKRYSFSEAEGWAHIIMARDKRKKKSDLEKSVGEEEADVKYSFDKVENKEKNIKDYEDEVANYIAKEYGGVVDTEKARIGWNKYIISEKRISTKLLTGDVKGGRHVSDSTTRESSFYDAEEEAYGWASRYRSIAESAVYDAMNVDFDFDFDSKFNTGWKEFENIGKRVRGQRGALNGKMNRLNSGNLTHDKVSEIIGRGYVSTLGVPVIYSEGEAKLPTKERNFTRDEVSKLVNRIAVCD